VTGAQPVAPKEGETVLGFFLDGDSGQFPVVLGIMPGVAKPAAPVSVGYTDGRTSAELASAPKTPQSVAQSSDGSGAVVTEASAAARYPKYADESTISRLARGETAGTVQEIRKNGKTTGVGTDSWEEPDSAFAPIYPYNRVIESESGHAFELDDTPGAERVHLAHRTGTFFETAPDGSQVIKVVKDKYTITLGNEKIFVAGDCSITVNGDANIYTKGDMAVKVDGGVTWTIKGDLSMMADGAVTLKSGGVTTIQAGGKMGLKAQRIDLN
jgi:hypothetical protein